MATEAKFVGTGANVDDGGALGWTNATNFVGDTTTTAATCLLTTNGDISQQLRGTNFGFTIPAGAVIQGITAVIEAGSANNSRQRWHTVQLLKSSGLVGDNLSTGASIQAKTTITFGGVSNLWNTTWSAEEVNDSSFGIAIKIDRSSVNTTTTSMFRCEITITYVEVVAPTVTTGSSANIATDSFDINSSNITDTGGASVTERGVVYMVGTSGDPTTANSKSSETGTFGTGTYNRSVTSLSDGTSYRVRAFAINSAGTSYGSTITVETEAIVAPTVTTQAVSSIAGTTATGNGNVTADGNATVTERGVVANTTGTPTTSDLKFAAGAGGTGAYTASMTSLSLGTHYYVRAYAINSAGTSYGSEVEFDTLDVPDAVDDLVATGGVEKVDLEWTAPANGGSAITGYKVYRDESSPATTLIDTLGDVLAYEDTDVTPGTEYFYRVKTTNAIGDSGFSNEDSATPSSPPLENEWYAVLK